MSQWFGSCLVDNKTSVSVSSGTHDDFLRHYECMHETSSLSLKKYIRKIFIFGDMHSKISTIILIQYHFQQNIPEKIPVTVCCHNIQLNLIAIILKLNKSFSWITWGKNMVNY
jgi:hypothetical protein